MIRNGPSSTLHESHVILSGKPALISLLSHDGNIIKAS